MKKFAIIALAALIALPASAAGVTISGYVDIGYWAAQNPQNGYRDAVSLNPIGGGLQASNATNGLWDGDNQFALNDVNIDLNTKFTDDISGYVSFNFVNGAAPTIDYAQIDFNNVGPMNNKISMGRFGSVIGIEQRVSEANLNRFINMTLLSPVTVGSIDGIGVFGSFSPVSYALAVSNNDNIGGASIGSAPMAPSSLNGAVGAVQDNNNDLAISGRLGVMPIEGLEIGVSASHTNYAPPIVAPGAVVDRKNPTRNIVGADASYTWGALTLKGEYVTVSEQQQTLATAAFINSPIRTTGYYVEGWYDWTSKIGVGVRYNRVRAKQDSPITLEDVVSDYSTISLAGAYRIADNVTFKVEYDVNDESVLSRKGTAGAEIDNDVIAASLVASF